MPARCWEQKVLEAVGSWLEGASLTVRLAAGTDLQVSGQTAGPTLGTSSSGPNNFRASGL